MGGIVAGLVFDDKVLFGIRSMVMEWICHLVHMKDKAEYEFCLIRITLFCWRFILNGENRKNWVVRTFLYEVWCISFERCNLRQNVSNFGSSQFLRTFFENGGLVCKLLFHDAVLRPFSPALKKTSGSMLLCAVQSCVAWKRNVLCSCLLL